MIKDCGFEKAEFPNSNKAKKDFLKKNSHTVSSTFLLKSLDGKAKNWKDMPVYKYLCTCMK